MQGIEFFLVSKAYHQYCQFVYSIISCDDRIRKRYSACDKITNERSFAVNYFVYLTVKNFEAKDGWKNKLLKHHTILQGNK